LLLLSLSILRNTVFRQHETWPTPRRGARCQPCRRVVRRSCLHAVTVRVGRGGHDGNVEPVNVGECAEGIELATPVLRGFVTVAVGCGHERERALVNVSALHGSVYGSVRFAFWIQAAEESQALGRVAKGQRP